MQNGTIVRISGNWHLRYWEKRNVDGVLKAKRVSFKLGPITTRGKKPPADIKDVAADHMKAIGASKIEAGQVVTMGRFVESVYLPWVKLHKKPSTEKCYRDIWRLQIKPHWENVWLRHVRTCDVQKWLDTITTAEIGRNTVKHAKSTLSAIFKHAKRQGYYDGINPVQDAGINGNAKQPADTYAYSLEEEQDILAHLPEPAATAFAIASYTGLRRGEIEGLRFEDYHDGSIYVTRSIWNGLEGKPKTSKSSAPVPVIKPLADRLEVHKARMGREAGPMFATGKGTPLSMRNMEARIILPALNRCVVCGKSQGECAQKKISHDFTRDSSLPEWRGWHACRRGLGSNLNRLGIDDSVIQRVLRHSNVATTQAFYISTSSADTVAAMQKLEGEIKALDTKWTPASKEGRVI